MASRASWRCVTKCRLASGRQTWLIPGSAGRSLLQSASGSACQPRLDLGGLVDGAMADDEPNIEGFGHLDVVQEDEELLAGVVSVCGASRSVVGTRTLS